MQSKKSILKKYIEILLLIIMSVGPFSPSIKIGMYFLVLLMNVKYIGEIIRVKLFHFVLIMSMVVPMLLDIRNVDPTTPYSLAGFAFLAPFIFCLVYIKGFGKQEFLLALENVIFFVSIVSIIGYIIMLSAPSIINRFPTINYYGRHVKTIGIYGAIRDYTQINFLNRNCGIAFEPGAFQFIPNLGLALLVGEKRQEKNIKFWIKVVVYAITVMTTYSSTGFVILGLILLISTFSNKKQFIIMLFVVVILSGALLTSYQYQIEKMQSGNFEGRFERSIYVVQNYSKYVFGIGSTGYDKIYSTNPMIGSWDTFTNMYIRFGLVFTLILVLLCIKLNKISVYVFITVLISLTTESLLGPIVVMLFYYSGQTNDNSRLELSERKAYRIRGLI